MLNKSRVMKHCLVAMLLTMPPPLSTRHFRTPFGFEELLTYLTREILRSQPENIYEFCSTTCQQLYTFIHSFFI